MKTDDFDYYLPEELIAQTPLLKREEARLLVLDRKNKKIEHKIFKDIKDYLKKGDVLVINDTKVLPARIIGVKEETGAHIELLLLKEEGGNIWEVLSKPFKRLKEGVRIKFSDKLSAVVIAKKEEGICRVKFIYDGIFLEILEELGTMPLPPYIKKNLPKDKQDLYQTVYAKDAASSAAPTAGLHFSKELIKELKDKGVIFAPITLHVGLGTFRPVNVENIKEHEMHSEFYIVSKESADIINEAKKRGSRVVAVGTTSVRTLESAASDDGTLRETSGWTKIFIYPGYKFKIIDNLITNFHLPKSTLIMLVSALASRELILKAYEEAVNEKYRFFSFGDAMFIGDDLCQ